MEELRLPPHIIKVSDKWYRNLNNDRFIHPDHIETVCANYWKAMAIRSGAKKESIKYKKNFKTSQRRWNDEL